MLILIFKLNVRQSLRKFVQMTERCPGQRPALTLRLSQTCLVNLCDVSVLSLSKSRLSDVRDKICINYLSNIFCTDRSGTDPDQKQNT